jgi:hypothetical protein
MHNMQVDIAQPKACLRRAIRLLTWVVCRRGSESLNMLMNPHALVADGADVDQVVCHPLHSTRCPDQRFHQVLQGLA